MPTYLLPFLPFILMAIGVLCACKSVSTILDGVAKGVEIPPVPFAADKMANESRLFLVLAAIFIAASIISLPICLCRYLS